MKNILKRPKFSSKLEISIYDNTLIASRLTMAPRKEHKGAS
jgi:hypothetical protein